MPATSVEELRSATRIGVRTPVVVYSFDNHGSLARSRAWTDDLSTTGARITTEAPLSGMHFYVRIMLPDLKDQIVSCEVIREIESSRDSFGIQYDIRRSYYGIRFTGLVEDDLREQVEALDNAVMGR